MTLLLAALLLLQEGITKEDVLRMTREGAKDEAILAKIGGAKFKLSADEVVELKKAGVSERVLTRMIAGPRDLKASNLSHRPVFVNLRGSMIEISLNRGNAIPPGEVVDLEASGEYEVRIHGRKMPWTLKTTATLTFRSCELSQGEVLFLQVEQGGELTTHILDVRD